MMAFAHRRREPDPLETTGEQLIEAREHADAGIRLAFPQLLSRLAEGQRPEEDTTAAPVDHSVAAKVATHLMDADDAIWEASKALPLEGQLELHHALQSVKKEIGSIAKELDRRWSDG